MTERGVAGDEEVGGQEDQVGGADEEDVGDVGDAGVLNGLDEGKGRVEGEAGELRRIEKDGFVAGLPAGAEGDVNQRGHEGVREPGKVGGEPEPEGDLEDLFERLRRGRAVERPPHDGEHDLDRCEAVHERADLRDAPLGLRERLDESGEDGGEQVEVHGLVLAF